MRRGLVGRERAKRRGGTGERQRCRGEKGRGEREGHVTTVVEKLLVRELGCITERS